MPLSADERETIITFSDGDATAHIWTAQRRIITKLSKNDAAVLIEEGRHDGSAFARFEIPADRISFLSSKKRQGNRSGNAWALAEYRSRNTKYTSETI